MKDYTIFDIIGPIMIGPSSSHTAGACRIGYTGHHIIKEDIVDVTFTLYGSFAKTYKGHGTDKALLGGVLGFKPDDSRIVKAFELARDRGLTYRFEPSDKEAAHPNTVLMTLTTATGKVWRIIGESIGGGKMQITKINDIDILFTGMYNTLITHHKDSPGLLANITRTISQDQINIANMKLYREAKGMKAIGIIEMDDNVNIGILEKINQIDGVSYVNLIEKIYD